MQLYSLFQKYPIICTDSRNCPQDSIFFALKGENFNANAYAKLALNNGCKYAVVDEAEYAIDERYILVDSVLESLQDLAKHHRKQLKTTIIGITGTNGKTTSKELIASVLCEKFNILYTQGNLNNHIGVPLTLLKMKSEHEIAVIEMGANHLGEIKILSEIACPDYGIITNVGKAHLEGFGSFEGIMKTKAELYDFIKNEGKLIFKNKDNKFLLKMADDAGLTSDKIIDFSLNSENKNCLVWGEISANSPFLEMNCIVNQSDAVNIKTKLVGAYNAENILAAVTIGNYFGIEIEKIKKGLENYTPQNNRSQLTITENNKLIVDAYNANPTSMAAAIKNFAEMDVSPKVLILGDMLELGDLAQQEHQAIVNLLKEHNLMDVFLVGDFFKQTSTDFCCFDNVELLMHQLEIQPIKNSYVIIKGSRGIKLENVLGLL